MNMRIGGRMVGEGCPAFIIAEAGINHQGEPEIARRLIDAAVEAGADAVKFQKRNPHSMLTEEAYNAPYTNGGNSFGRTYGEHRERLELSEVDYFELKRYSYERGILFLTSPWDHPSADFLELLGMPAFKIGSPDLTNLPLCRFIARKGLPVILSTGMSELWEVEKTVEEIRKINDQLILLHCVSIYPPDYSELNLKNIALLRDKFGLPVGYSGHELGWDAVIAAVALGACVIEKHITVDRTMKGGDHHFSLEPHELKAMVTAIRQVEQALTGDGKILMGREIPFRKKLGKSLVSTRRLRKNEVLREELLTCKSPATGISPLMMDELIGHRVRQEISGDATIHGGDVNLE